MLDYTIMALVIFAYFGVLSMMAGNSFPPAKEWLAEEKWRGQLPEFAIGLSIGGLATPLWSGIFGLSGTWPFFLFIALSAIAYAGKQSATWAYLTWEGYWEDKDGDGVITEADGRDSTMRKWNDWLASRLRYKLGDEGYSWVWAFTKGLITTLPLFGTGAIFQPLWREAFSHAKGRLKGDPNMWMELGDGFAYATSVMVFLWLT